MSQNFRIDQYDENNPFISMRQLYLFMAKGYSLIDDENHRRFEIHSQDTELILKTAESIYSGEDHTIIVPYLNSVTLAFLVRALAVATVGKNQVVVYSPDHSFRRYYREMSYLGRPFDPSIANLYPLRREFQVDNRVTNFMTLRELQSGSSEDEPDPSFRGSTLIVDLRVMRSLVHETNPPWKDYKGPRVFLTLLESDVVSQYKTSYCRSTGKKLGDWPTLLEQSTSRLNNYSSGPELSPISIPGSNNALDSLERSMRQLRTASSGIETIQFQIYQAGRLNHFMQDSIVPLSLYEQAAKGLGQYWLSSLVQCLKSTFSYPISANARTAMKNFLFFAEVAVNDLSLRHPPKVDWLKRFLLENSRDDQVIVYCRAKIEYDAIKLWNESDAAAGCPKLMPITRATLMSGGLAKPLIIPGPPTFDDIPYLIGGISKEISVLAYSWQAPHWNGVRACVSRILEKVKQLQEPPPMVDDFESMDISWQQKNTGAFHLDEEDIVKEEFSERIVNKIELKTDFGEMELDEESLLPTLELDKFVDRPAKYLKKGDVIIIRTTGDVIDARREVDELAKTHPLLADAAMRAGAWRDILLAFAKSSNMRLKAVHTKLFPKDEVSYATVRGWFIDSSRIGPNNKNLLLLLRRIGISEEQALGLLDDVRIYRGYRFRVYNHLYDMWNKYASKLYQLDDDVVEEQSEKIDSEFGMTLASLDNLITFARVTENPTPKDDNFV